MAEEEMERLAEQDDLPTRAGKPLEPTEAVQAWQVEDSAPEPAAPVEESEESQTRSWSETFEVIAKYGGMAALVALVGLMFLDDHLPRHLQQAVGVHQTPVANVPPSPPNASPLAWLLIQLQPSHPSHPPQQRRRLPQPHP